MAHEIDFTNGNAAFAYVGDKAWHGLGNQLNQESSIEDWQVSAGMDWEIKASPVFFAGNNGEISEVADRKVLYRSDVGSSLSVVGDQYKVVQPKQVLEFFRDLVNGTDAWIETAGCLFEGRKFYAMANMNTADYVGNKNDITKSYLLLTTSCDSTSATSAIATSCRVVCANTHRYAVEKATASDRIRVTHRQDFDSEMVKRRLADYDLAWGNYIEKCNMLASKKISDSDAMSIFQALVYTDPVKPSPQSVTQADLLMSLYKNGLGADMTYGNMYGVLNAVTEQVDHHSRVRSDDRKFMNRFAGAGDKMKQEAFDMLMAAV